MPETVEATEEVEQPENQKAPSASEMNEEAKIFSKNWTEIAKPKWLQFEQQRWRNHGLMTTVPCEGHVQWSSQNQAPVGP